MYSTVQHQTQEDAVCSSQLSFLRPLQICLQVRSLIVFRHH